MRTLVPDKVTPLSLEDGLDALAAGYRRTMGGPIDSARTFAALGAQLCLESGNFKKAHCFNWGNHKTPHDWEGLYCQFKCDELFDQHTAQAAINLGPCVVTQWKSGPLQRVILIPPHPWTSFVAFETAEDGTADYVRLLACEDRYRAAWHEAIMGRFDAFSHALHAARYYTAEVLTYTRGLVSIANKLLPACQLAIDGQPHGIDDGFREFVAAQVYETLMDSKDTDPHQMIAADDAAPEGHPV